tara:strand:- start:737 stop:877 length:141 start_codon:yes stop_codon:yes gene_type:complete
MVENEQTLTKKMKVSIGREFVVGRELVGKQRHERPIKRVVGLLRKM